MHKAYSRNTLLRGRFKVNLFTDDHKAIYPNIKNRR